MEIEFGLSLAKVLNFRSNGYFGVGVMRKLVFLCTVLVLLLESILCPTFAQQNQVTREINALPWQSYPAVGTIGSTGRNQSTNDFHSVDTHTTRRFIELNGKPADEHG